MPEFHIDDPVVNIFTGDSFTIKGVLKEAKGMLYCGERVGWTLESDLDHDFSPEVKAKLAPVDAELHSVRVATLALKDEVTELRKHFNDAIPFYIKEGITELTTILTEIAR